MLLALSVSLRLSGACLSRYGHRQADHRDRDRETNARLPSRQCVRLADSSSRSSSLSCASSALAMLFFVRRAFCHRRHDDAEKGSQIIIERWHKEAKGWKVAKDG